MVRSSWSLVARSLVLAGGVCSMGLASRDAHAAKHVGFIPPHAGPHFQDSTPFGGSTAATCGVVTYCGGPVLSNVQVIPVYWTNGVSSTITGWAPGYLKTLTGSTFMDMLSEYSTKGKVGEICGEDVNGGIEYFGRETAFTTNQTITRGTATAAVTITPMVTTGTTIMDDNGAIGDELAAQIKAGKLAAPTYDAEGYPNTLYFVFFPASYSITLQGQGSCSAFGGYHYSSVYTTGSCVGQYLPYAVIPDCGDGTSDLSVTASHELAEATSDTDVGTTGPDPNAGDGAWYLGPTNPNPNNSDPTCGEIGDVCQSAGDTTVTGTSVVAQYIWSQVQNGCEIDNSSLGVQTGPSGTPVTKCKTVEVDAGGGGHDGGGGGDGGGGDDSGSPGDSGSALPDATIGGGGQNDGGGLGNEEGGLAGSTEDGGGSAGNGSGSGGTTPSSGCSCELPRSGGSSSLGAFGALLALGLVVRGRARRRS